MAIPVLHRISFCSLLILQVIRVNAQVTVAGSGGSANGTYANLKLAFDALNTIPDQAGNVITLSITANITDNTSAVLNQPTVNAWTSLTITPSGGAWILDGSIAGPLIDINGADNVTIDGINSGGNSLTISNTSTSNAPGTSTIRLINDAGNNTITHCTILGSSTGLPAQSGTGTIPGAATILIAGSNGSTGNDNNSITDNIIAEAGNNKPVVSFCSAGQSTTISNDQITISGNQFSNFYGNNGANGISVASNSSAFTISSNKFFQTATRSGMFWDKYYESIFINTPSGGNYQITGNTIGYANANGTGMLTNTGGRFIGIDLTSVANSPASEVQGNTINGIYWTLVANYNHYTTAGFYGLVVRNGSVEVGTDSGNIFGDTEGTGSSAANIFIEPNFNSTTIDIIYLNSSADCTIAHNHIGAIGTGSGQCLFYNIIAEGTGSHAVISNMIGNSSVSGISLGVPTDNTSKVFYGIYTNSSGAVTIGNENQGNTIQNIGFLSKGFNEFSGIWNAGNANTLNINDNLIHSILYSGIQNNGSAFTGIRSSNNTTGAINVRRNQMGTAGENMMHHDILSGTPSGNFTGISMSAAPSANLSIEYNDFRGITSGANNGLSYLFITWNHSASSTTNISHNTFTGLTLKSSGNVLFLSGSGNMTATGTLNITHNAIITGFSKTSGGGTVYCYNSSGQSVNGSVENFQNNNFSNLNLPGNTVLVAGNFINGTNHTSGPKRTITGNLFNNFITGSAITGFIINCSAAGSLVSQNQFQQWSGGGSMMGIQFESLNTATGSITVSENIICGLNSTNGSSMVGIQNPNYSGTISKNKICDLNTGHTNPTVWGLVMNSSSFGNGVQNISNNYIGNLTAPAATGNNAVIGLNIHTAFNGPFTYNVFYNTIYLSGSGANGFGSSGILHWTHTSADWGTLNLRNNIVINNSTPVGSGQAVAFRRSTGNGGHLNNYGSASNHNFFYAGNPGPGHLIYSDGSFTAATIEAYRSGNFPAGIIFPRDAQSVSGPFDPATFFLSTNGTSADFLHIHPETAVPIESGASPIASYTDDFDGDSRHAQLPDIGADEGDFIHADLLGPLITYTPIPEGLAADTHEFSNVIITDYTGVDTVAGLRPRVYYKRSSDQNVYNDNTSNTPGWKYVEASNTTSPFTFIIDYTLLSGGTGVSSGHQIQYFVIAQDEIATPNVSTKIAFFSNPPFSIALSAAQFPLSGPINFYQIAPGISGIITVPGTYSSLTHFGGAFAAINSAVVTGDIEIQVTGDVNETGIIALDPFTSPYTIRIYPVNSSRTIIGAVSAAGIIRLNGADRVTIDGSIGGTGVDRSLVINNQHSNAPACIGLQSQGAGNGCDQIAVKNCNLNISNTGAQSFGVAIGGNTPGTPGADHDGVTIQNNAINNAATGIYAYGTSSGSSGGLDNLQIIGNNINVATSAFDAFGIRTGQALNSLIADNAVAVISSASNYPVGISLETGFVSSSILRNYITAVWSNGTTGFGGRGISIGTGTSNSELLVANNVIYNVNGSNHSSIVRSSMGISIGLLGNTLNTINTGGIKLYYNSVHLYFSIGIFSNAITAALYAGVNSSNLDIRNNIFSNTNYSNSGGQKNYGIYADAPASAFSLMDYNDYYAANTGNQSLAIRGFLNGDLLDLASIQSAFGQNVHSIISSPMFVSDNSLKLTPGPAMEAGNVDGTGITTDILDEIRSTEAPPNGSAMGAFEKVVDTQAPLITYTALTGDCSTGDRIIIATITDGLGVPVTGIYMPRIYFKKNSGAYTSTQGVLTAGSGRNGTWTFTISASAMGGLSANDIVSYFVIAQDIATPFNLIAMPGAGLVASNVNTITNFPVNPHNYSVYYTFGSGVYSVGAGTTQEDIGHFPTLTAAINAYNTGCFSGEVEFVLTNTTINSGESFPITLQHNPNASNLNRLIIRPAANVTSHIISNHPGGTIVLNGADYVTINGSNNGSSSKDLTITNDNTGGNAIRFQNDATNSTVEHCIIKGANNSADNGIIYIASTNGPLGNDQLTIRQNDITSDVALATVCIYNSGNNSSTETKNSGIQIIGNNIYNFRYAGLRDAGGSKGTIYRGNKIYSISEQNTGQLIGFVTSSNSIEGFLFEQNHIYDLKSTGGELMGVMIAGNAASALTSGDLINNMISLQTLNNQNTFGIYDNNSAGLLKVYNNTISISGSGGSWSGCITRWSAGTMECRNNLLSNTRINAFQNYNYLFWNHMNGFSGDYNDLYVTFWGRVAYINGSNLQTLSSWQQTGQDPHSISVVPAFMSPTDLHLAANGNCDIESKGISIPSVMGDIDNDIRSGSPDIGADEFESVPLTGLSAGQDQVLCSTSALLSASSGPSGSVGTWSVVTGAGTFVPNVNDPNATVNGLAFGDNTFKWTVQYGSCSTRDTIKITNNSAAFTQCPNTTIVWSDTCGTEVFYAIQAAGVPAPTLSYSFSGATIGSGSGTGTGSHFNPGATYVTVTASNGCGADALCTFLVDVWVGELHVEGNDMDIHDGQTNASPEDHTDFGVLFINTDHVHYFVINNPGLGALSLSNVTISGPDASMFSSDWSGPVDLYNGQYYFLGITFTPTSPGLKTATVHISSNDCETPDFDFVISGTGENRFHFIGSGAWTQEEKWEPFYPGLTLEAGYEAYADDVNSLNIPQGTTVVIDGIMTHPSVMEIEGDLILGPAGVMHSWGVSVTGTLTTYPGSSLIIDAGYMFCFFANPGVIHNGGTLEAINNAVITNEGFMYNDPGGVIINSYGFDNAAGLFENNGIYTGSGIFIGIFNNEMNGTISPGNSVGCHAFETVIVNEGVIAMEILGAGEECVEFDKLNMNGAIELGGTLDVLFGFTPDEPEEITIIEATELTGTFSNVLMSPDWTVHYDYPSIGMVTLKYNCIETAILTQPEYIQTVCQFSSTAYLEVIAEGSALSYQWYLDNDNAGYSGSPIDGATEAIYVPSTQVPGSYNYYAVVSGACGVINSQYGYINVDARGVWKGVVNADWFEPGNWCGGVPDETTNVLIPYSPFHYPIISGSNAICYSLVLLPEVALEIHAGSELRVVGD